MAAQDIDIGRVGGAADDPFALGGAKGNKIHIRVQQRNGRKSITTIQVRLGRQHERVAAGLDCAAPCDAGSAAAASPAGAPSALTHQLPYFPRILPFCARLAGPGARPGPEAHLQGDEARV